MKTEILVIIGIFLSFALLEAFKTGFLRKRGQTGDDGWVELFSTLLLLAFTQPIVLLAGGMLASLLVPQFQGILLQQPFWLVFLLFLLFDDLTQYWWHRLSHSVVWLYKLHRPHHNAEYLSIRIVYRNNFFYYMLMPGLWCSGILIYLGGAYVYAFYIVIKMAVICGVHSDVRWDKKLYEIRWLSPLMWVVERLISTPSTHAAHHGKHSNDGVTHYKGNYGNLLFLWDVIFGTAKITRRYPEQYGVEKMPKTNVQEQLFWPLVRIKKAAKQSRHTVSG